MPEEYDKDESQYTLGQNKTILEGEFVEEAEPNPRSYTEYEYSKLQNDFLQFLHRINNEITELRKRVEYLEPKAAAYDHLTTLTGVVADLRSNGSRSMSEDVLWRIRKKIDELEPKNAVPTSN